MEKVRRVQSTIVGTLVLVSFAFFLLFGVLFYFGFDRELRNVFLLLGIVTAYSSRICYVHFSKTFVKESYKTLKDFDRHKLLNMLTFPGATFSVHLSGNNIIINYNVKDTINSDILKEEDIGKVLVFHVEHGVFTLYAGDRYGNEDRNLLYRCFADMDEEDIYRSGYEPSAVGSFVSAFLTKNGFSADCRESAVKNLADGLRNEDIALSGHQFR